jgi:hypothetical protein
MNEGSERDDDVCLNNTGCCSMLKAVGTDPLSAKVVCKVASPIVKANMPLILSGIVAILTPVAAGTYAMREYMPDLRDISPMVKYTIMAGVAGMVGIGGYIAWQAQDSNLTNEDNNSSIVEPTQCSGAVHSLTQDEF